MNFEEALTLEDALEEARIMLQELQEEIEDEILQEDSTIQVLYDENGYLCDWYYDHEVMEEDHEEEISGDDEDAAQRAEAVWQQYLDNRENLKPRTVDETLKELQEFIDGNNSF